MTNITQTPASPAASDRFAHLNECSAEQVNGMQAVLKRVRENSRTERMAHSRPSPAGSLGRAASPRFTSIRQVADFILTAGRGAKR